MLTGHRIMTAILSTLQASYLMGFDVVIPCAEKDQQTLPYVISGIRQHVQDAERIFVVSKDRLTNEAEWIPESAYPFTFHQAGVALFQNDAEAFESAQSKGWGRTGWYFQQLLKIYLPVAYPDISPYFLVVDADTVFTRDVAFFEEGIPCYCPGQEYHAPYFEHMVRVLPWLRRVHAEYSGISHHMLLNSAVLETLRQEIESIHQRPCWQAFLLAVDPDQRKYSGASEYELYFNYIQLKNIPMKIRQLFWKNYGSVQDLLRYQQEGLDFVALHCYVWTFENAF